MKKVVCSRIVFVFATGLFVLGFREAGAGGPPTPPLPAMPITLAWNAAEDSSVSGYAVYYGQVGLPATNRVDAGSNTTVTIFGMRANQAYRLYAVSYNLAGLESLPSNELLLTPPVLSRLRLFPQPDGSMQLSAKAAPGTLWSLQYTSSLQTPVWQTLTGTSADALGNLALVDFSAGEAKCRYYRLAFGWQALSKPQ